MWPHLTHRRSRGDAQSRPASTAGLPLAAVVGGLLAYRVLFYWAPVPSLTGVDPPARGEFLIGKALLADEVVLGWFGDPPEFESPLLGYPRISSRWKIGRESESPRNY